MMDKDTNQVGRRAPLLVGTFIMMLLLLAACRESGTAVETPDDDANVPAVETAPEGEGEDAAADGDSTETAVDEEKNLPATPTAESPVVADGPAGSDDGPVNCNAWSLAQSYNPGMSITGPASVHPFDGEEAEALAEFWELSYVEGWAIRIEPLRVVIVPDTVTVATGDAVEPRGLVRYYSSGAALNIAERSNFSERCQ